MRGYRERSRFSSSSKITALKYLGVGFIIGSIGMFILLTLKKPSEPVQVVVSTPLPPPTVDMERFKWSEGGNIGLTRPEDNEIVQSPLTISGVARVAENNVYIRLKEAHEKDVKVLLEAVAEAKPQDQGFHGKFESTIIFSPTIEQGTLEIFGKAKDGEETDKVVIPLKFRIQK